MKVSVPLVLRRGWLVLLLAAAVSLPWLVEPYDLQRYSSMLQLGVAVLSLTLLVGLCGQISIGQASFVGVGAYTTTILVTTYAWPLAGACIAGILLSAAAGLLVGLPSLRLRGLYVVLTSLGLAIVFPTLLQATRELTGGTAGMSLGTLILAPEWTGLTDAEWIYFISLVITGIACLLVNNLKRSRVGRSLQAIRDNELVAESFGIRVSSAKLVCISVSGGLAGLSGCLFTIQRQFVSPSDFGLMRSIDYFVGMAVGGQYSVLGAIFGGGFLEFTPTWLRDTGVSPVLTPLLYGAALILVIILFRDGLAGAGELLLRLASRRFASSSARRGPTADGEDESRTPVDDTATHVPSDPPQKYKE